MKGFFLSLACFSLLASVAWAQPACQTPCRNSGIRASAIYWNAYSEGSSYTLTDDAFASGGQTWVNNVMFQEIPLQAWGAKVGVNRILGCTQWDFDVLWTWLDVSNSRTAFRTQNTSGTFQGHDVNDIWLIRGNNAPNAMRGHQHLNYNTIEITLNRDICCCWFDLRTLFGLDVAWITNKLKVDYIGNGSYVPGDDAPYMLIENDFRGVGPLVGLAPSFPLCWGLSLDAFAHLSTLWGRFNLDQLQHSTLIDGGPLEGNIRAPKKRNSIAPHLDLGLTLNWEYCFRCWSAHLGVGYEVSYWLNYMRQYRYHNLTNAMNVGSADKVTTDIFERQGDLILNGLNLSAGINF